MKEKELKALQFADGDASNAGAIVLNIIAKYASSYSDLIEGKFVKDTATEFMGGSRISYIFFDV